MKDYRRCIDHWDAVFAGEDGAVPASSETGNSALDGAIRWLCADSVSVLDFGCGNGALLFLCALNGTREHLGIDLSKEAIRCACRNAAHMRCGDFEFRQGGVGELTSVPDAAYDAVILSNIVDNLYPEDAMLLIRASARVLRCGGKALVKLNPYLTPEQIADWNIRPISGDLLDDGLLLWNNTTQQWREILRAHFSIASEGEVYYPEHDQTNRLFYLLK